MCGKYYEMKNIRTISLTGAAASEKGRIIHTVSDILSDCEQELFYSPFSHFQPCALYLPELGFLINGECQKIYSHTFFDKTINIGNVLKNQPKINAAVANYTLSQGNFYKKRTYYLMWILNLLLNEYIKSTSDLLSLEKLKIYAIRKFRSFFPQKTNCIGKKYIRSISAITCSGYKIQNLPKDYKIIILMDSFISASAEFVKIISSAANSMGYDTFISHAIDIESSPMHLIIPEKKLAFLSNSPLLETNCPFDKKINLNRFYHTNLIAECEHQTEFYADIIRKFIGEATLNVKICTDLFTQCRRLISPYISRSSTDNIAAEIVYDIINS